MGLGPFAVGASPILAMPLLRAFLVEDNPMVRDNLVAALRELVPLEVVGCVGDEAAALAWLESPEHRCDVVIVDILLEAGSGVGLLRRLQARGEKVERVVLSNHVTPGLRRHCLALGATQVFDKSRQIDDLVAHCIALALRLLPAEE